ncbi:MAG: YggT family protein [Candidatus Gracilibacteria bacterium]|nr:YggT family protein [Candidatus Gracilibacteria bacterium]
MIIDYICLIILIFLNLIEWVIIIDIIFSWLQLFGLKIKIDFIRSITTPIYFHVRKYLPTTIGPVDFAPIIIFIMISIISSFITYIRPEVISLLPSNF